MTEQTKPPIAPSLERIAAFEEQLTWTFPNGDVYARLGLILTVYFAKGYSPEGRDRIAKCFEYFVARYGEHLKGKQFSGAGSGNYVTLRKGDVEKLAAKARKLEPSIALCWHLSSEPTQELAPEYAISTLSSQDLLEDRDGDRSSLKICLPWRILDGATGVQQYLELVRFICNTLQVEHGYAGLSPVLPYNFDRYLSLEYYAAKEFAGLIIDTYSFVEVDKLKNHSIKGVNWLTIVGNELLDRLDGKEAVQAKLKQAGITVHGYNNGIIAQAGGVPSLGAPDEALPALYVAANKVFKPIRIKEPEQLHHYMPDQESFDKDATLAWYARFDIPSEAPAALPGRGRCEAGQPCPQSGFWFTPAKAGSRRYFKADEPMPVLGGDYGSTIWQWDPNQDMPKL